MAQAIVFNGVSYSIPDTGDEDWGEDLTAFFVAISQGALQKIGGTFTLTADANFGASFGLVVAYLKSMSSNLSTAGIVRLARTDTIGWRNAANSANLLLAVDGSNNLTFGGVAIPLSGLIVNADVAAAAAIARSKLASGTNYRILANSSLGVMSENAALTYHRIIVADANGQLANNAALTSGRVVIVDSNGELADEAALTISRGGTGQATASAGFNALSPITTKGDIITGSGVNTGIRLGVGLDGQVLTADALESTGVKWATTSASPTSSYEINNLGLAASVATNLLTVNLKQSDGSSAPAAGEGAVKIVFRSSTITSGAYVERSKTGALSINTVATGCTLGLVSAQNQYIYVYAIDNAGTVELALSGSRAFDEGALHNTTAINGSSTNALVLYSTTARTGVAIRLIGRVLSNQATSGTFATAIAAVAAFTSYQDKQERSQLVLNTYNAYGSEGSNKIPRFSTIISNTGSAMTYTDSVTLGMSVLINEDGLYFAQHTGSFVASEVMGISIDASRTTTVNNLSSSALATYTVVATTYTPSSTSGLRFLSAGNVIRAHTTGVALNPGSGSASFQIIKISD